MFPLEKDSGGSCFFCCGPPHKERMDDAGNSSRKRKSEMVLEHEPPTKVCYSQELNSFLAPSYRRFNPRV